MKRSLLAIASLLLIFVATLNASPIWGSRIITPSNASERGIRFTFHEHKDGRIRARVFLKPEKVRKQIDTVGFAKLMTASYLDEEQTQLIAELGDKLVKGKSGELTAGVVLHKKTLANAKVWIEFGYGDGFIRLNIQEFVKDWHEKREILKQARSFDEVRSIVKSLRMTNRLEFPYEGGDIGHYLGQFVWSDDALLILAKDPTLLFRLCYAVRDCAIEKDLSKHSMLDTHEFILIVSGHYSNTPLYKSLYAKYQFDSPDYVGMKMPQFYEFLDKLKASQELKKAEKRRRILL